MSEKENQEKIQQLQMMEQTMQNFLMQRQQFQIQLNEIDSALTELKGQKVAYKIVSSIMIKADPKNLEKELNEKKRAVELRISSLEKHEEKMKEKAKSIQQDVLGSMKK
ncbi:prefoldin subunit [Candidatus Woesearchaeota archaeon]|nr:prefoldin subunit [Candidatus Woesearchaeota archaeon]